MERFLRTPLADPVTGDLKLAQLMGALSHALDMTEGQPAGHCVRCCWTGMQIGQALGLSEDAQWALYYVLLLKDLGCSSNAARISALYLTDDLGFKRDYKTVGDSLPAALGFVLRHTGLRAGLAERFRAVANIVRNGGEIARELIETRCQRGADIARQLRFPEAVAMGVQHLDEHWNGRGKPLGLAGDAIVMPARIALLAQVVDVFHTAEGPDAAREEIRRRSGSWFEPRLCEVFLQLSASAAFWEALAAPDLQTRVFALEPACREIPIDDDYLDDIAAAFGQVVDSKSPYTSGHSQRVAHYAELIAARMGLSEAHRRWLHRGALLHDLGKLGVSNAILDKPGKLDEEEWLAVQRHAAFTEAILARIEPFAELARVAAAHHERLDGKGYPRGLTADEITLETRIITTADIFDAITAERPYRGAIPIPRTLEMMAESSGSAIDPDCLQALRDVLAGQGPEAL